MSRLNVPLFIADCSTLNDTVIKAAKRKQDETFEMSQRKYVKPDTTTEMKIDLEPESENQVEAKRLASSLHSAIAKERTQLDSYEQYLQKAVEEGENMNPQVLPNINMNNFNTPTLVLDSFSTPGRRRESEILTSPLLTLASPRVTLTPVRLRSPAQDVYDVEDSEDGTLADGVDRLKASLQSQKSANKLYEMRLQALLTDSFS